MAKSSVDSAGAHRFHGRHQGAPESGSTAITLLMAIAFGVLTYVILSVFLVSNQHQVFRIQAVQQEILLRNLLRRSIDCQLSCVENRLRIPEKIASKQLSVECTDSAPHEIRITYKDAMKRKKKDLWQSPAGQRLKPLNLCSLEQKNPRRLKGAFLAEVCPHSSRSIGVDFRHRKLICTWTLH